MRIKGEGGSEKQGRCTPKSRPSGWGLITGYLGNEPLGGPGRQSCEWICAAGLTSKTCPGGCPSCREVTYKAVVAEDRTVPIVVTQF